MPAVTAVTARWLSLLPSGSSAAKVRGSTYPPGRLRSLLGLPCMPAWTIWPAVPANSSWPSRRLTCLRLPSYGLFAAILDHPGVWERASHAYLNEVLTRKQGIPAGGLAELPLLNR